MKNKFSKLSNKIGETSLALLFLIANRSGLILRDILSGSSRGLAKTLGDIEMAKTLGDYQKNIRNLTINNTRTILWRLKNKGLVSTTSLGNYSLTNLGSQFIQEIKKKTDQARWDGKWRMVLFDIPETKRRHRLWLNACLARSGYKQIQKSVLIGKFPVDEELLSDLIEKDLYRYVRIITIGEIDDESVLEI